ncbi:triose-phosphate isomerase [Ignisphaera sp. 4213-co]|uniref:Triosephosphate isomerase n=1 Tax=Ignisphaera cupida TaxID=3050454 RepID=A0ABD4Z7D8_9CREN|nr:triose-phosphate isomerase [Ignisphaera sp. 4213-co]MDK6029049.1 triose-phosphate isomerase [Ignisphaera sp. 4213-co]
MKTPVLAINFKVYNTSFGQKAVDIAKAGEKAAKEYGIEVIVIPPATELRRIASEVSIPVFAQHADPYDFGAYTGWLPIAALKEMNIKGVLVNHSEHRLRLDEIVAIVEAAKKHGLETLVCADTPIAAAAVAAIKPTALAVEPPELIGTGIAVSKAKPEIITNTVQKVREVNKDVIILTGAGISTAEDVEAAIRLGTAGVLVASAIMKAQNPEKVINDMAMAAAKAYRK